MKSSESVAYIVWL